MNEEYLKFVELHNIDMKIAEEVYAKELEYGNRYFGAPATSKVVNRNALYQLRVITGIK